MKSWNIVGWGLGILLMISIIESQCSSSGSRSESTSSSSYHKSSRPAPREEPPKTFRMGEAFQFGNYLYQVHDISYRESISTGWFDTERPLGVFLVVDITVYNRSGKTQNVSSTLFKLKDNNGNEYKTTHSNFKAYELSPEMEVTGQVVFDVHFGRNYTLLLAEDDDLHFNERKYARVNLGAATADDGMPMNED
ncbi:DUF4352 domain-containing protein [Rikenella microfusus]|nr:DUF4352 domain-containing protein [Rikenella microfusus]HJE87965.1 DUF4352 domain-containing protein [Rikenella microfusus]